MGDSPISSYVTGETINTLSAPSTKRLASVGQKEKQQTWRQSAGNDNFRGVTREQGKSALFLSPQREEAWRAIEEKHRCHRQKKIDETGKMYKG